MGLNHDATTYEDIHFNHIKKRMAPGQIVYDVGVYDGITSVLLAQAVGGENVVLIEPAENNWGTVRAYWNAHGFALPKATYAGFIGQHDTTDAPESVVHLGTFPPESDWFPASYLEEHSRFRTIQLPEGRPQLSIDTLARVAGIPAGITIDIEGAELLAVLGAKSVLLNHRPLVWISIHPSFMKDRFGHTKQQLIEQMNAFGYQEICLAIDHEEHYFFEPKENVWA